MKALRNLLSNPKILDTKLIVGGLQAVLMVSFLEVYLKDLTKLICNDYVAHIKWPEKSSGKIDLSDLNNETSVGDLVLCVLIEQKGVNFQDLQSIIRFFKDYLGIAIKLDEVYVNNIILATAMRHTIIHSAGVIDGGFKKQVRKIPKGLYDKYTSSGTVQIDDIFLTEIRDSILNLANLITNELNTSL